MTAARVPRAPSHLSEESRVLWRRVVKEYAFEPHHLKLFEAACGSWDRVLQSREAIEEHGLLIEGRYGLRANPAVAMERQAKAAFLSSMRDLDLDAETRPYR
jgi:P27 family predicted phage terminase small subunit